MIVVDIGNTNIVIGYYTQKKLQNILRFETEDNNLINKLNKNFNSMNLKRLKIKKNFCIISSVSKKNETNLIQIPTIFSISRFFWKETVLFFCMFWRRKWSGTRRIPNVRLRSTLTNSSRKNKQNVLVHEFNICHLLAQWSGLSSTGQGCWRATRSAKRTNTLSLSKKV